DVCSSDLRPRRRIRSCEQDFFDGGPIRTNRVRRGDRSGGSLREEDALDTRREIGIGEDFLEVVDENIASCRGDAPQLLRERAFKEDGSDEACRSLVFEEA